MSTSTIAAPPRPRTVLRVWIPLIVIVLLGGAFAAVWMGPSDEFPRFYRVVASMAIISLTALLFTIWWFALSRLPWAIRLALPVLVVAAAVGCIRKVEFSGDMDPLFLFRWTPPADDVLDAYRQAHSAVPVEDTKTAETPDDDPADYPEYRNRARDGVARGPALSRNWTTKPPRLLWKHPCGGGYAGIAVAGDFAVTIEQRREEEALVCYDAATGQERWAYSYPAHFHDPRAEGPMATPTLVGGDVYSMGGTGKLVCMRLATGEFKWKVDALEDNDNLMWGMSGSPLVYDDVVVVTPGEQRAGEGRAVVAYDRKTGKKVWGAGNKRGGYSSPMLATLCGVRQVVVFEGKQVAGYDAAGAGELWSVPWEAQNDINVAQPLVIGSDQLFITSGYGTLCGVIRLVRTEGDWKAEKEWSNPKMRCRFSSPVLYQGLVYGLDEGILECLDPVNGERVWRSKQRYALGQLLRCDDLLLVMTELNELALVEAAKEKSHELGRLKVLEGDKTWNCPTLARGKAYVRNHVEMACYDLRD